MPNQLGRSPFYKNLAANLLENKRFYISIPVNYWHLWSAFVQGNQPRHLCLRDLSLPIRNDVRRHGPWRYSVSLRRLFGDVWTSTEGRVITELSIFALYPFIDGVLCILLRIYVQWLRVNSNSFLWVLLRFQDRRQTYFKQALRLPCRNWFNLVCIKSRDNFQ